MRAPLVFLALGLHEVADEREGMHWWRHGEAPDNSRAVVVITRGVGGIALFAWAVLPRALTDR